MDVARFLQLISSIQKDHNTLKIRQQLVDLVQATKEQINDPGDDNRVVKMRTALRTLIESLEHCESNVFGPIRGRVLRDEKGEHAPTGRHLASQLGEAYQAALVQKDFLSDVKVLHNRFDRFDQEIRETVSLLKRFGIRAPKPPPRDKIELGLRIPISANAREFSRSDKGLRDWLMVLETLAEIERGEPIEITIRGLGTGSLEVVLLLTAFAGKAVMFLAQKYAEWKKTLAEANEISARAYLTTRQAHTEAARTRQEEAKARLIEALTDDLIGEKGPHDDEATNHELRNKTSKAIQRTMRLIDEGSVVEAFILHDRSSPAPGPEVEALPPTTSAPKRLETHGRDATREDASPSRKNDDDIDEEPPR